MNIIQVASRIYMDLHGLSYHRLRDLLDRSQV